MGEPVLHDLHPPVADLRREVLAGLGAQPKRLTPKLFYDTHGSRLFDAITALPEYYPTRTEIGILRGCRDELAALLGPDAVLIEPGGGNGIKARLLLDAIDALAYIPIDIARQHLFDAAEGLATDYPELEIHAVCADFSRPLALPELPQGGRRVAFFPGSSIGNFDPPAATALLERLADLAGRGGALLIGADLLKDEARLTAAYDDVQGVTAAFNLNILARINRELDGDFDLDAFDHSARFNRDAGRVEMHLVSRDGQTITVGDESFAFTAGESIHTENAYKYTRESFVALAAAAGFRPWREWTDADGLFAVFLFSC
jgi:dimethylhistidine N-methyltransferase